MVRLPNTTVSGISFSKATIKLVWEKASIEPGYSKGYARKDICGWWIIFDKYGNRESDHGWEIDHINPVSNGGTGEQSNLQPLNWRNNSEKGGKLDWKC